MKFDISYAELPFLGIFVTFSTNFDNFRLRLSILGNFYQKLTLLIKIIPKKMTKILSKLAKEARHMNLLTFNHKSTHNNDL